MQDLQGQTKIHQVHDERCDNRDQTSHDLMGRGRRGLKANKKLKELTR